MHILICPSTFLEFHCFDPFILSSFLNVFASQLPLFDDKAAQRCVIDLVRVTDCSFPIIFEREQSYYVDSIL